MSWIDKLLPPQIQQTDPSLRKSVPEGLWVKCVSCEAVLYRTDIEANQYVCPKCNHHMRIRARERLDFLLDKEGRYEIGQEILPIDPLKFKDTKKLILANLFILIFGFIIPFVINILNDYEASIKD